MAWMNHFTVQPGKETLTGVTVTFGSKSTGSNGVLNGGPAQIFILSDPNGDGNPSDAQVLRSANTTIINVDTGLLNRLAITPVTLAPGASFFVGAMVTSMPLNRNPAAIDTRSTDPFGFPQPSGHASDAWVAAGGDGSFGLNNLSSAEYFGNPSTLIGPSFAGPFMVRGETVVAPEPTAICMVSIAVMAVGRNIRFRDNVYRRKRGGRPTPGGVMTCPRRTVFVFAATNSIEIPFALSGNAVRRGDQSRLEPYELLVSGRLQSWRRAPATRRHLRWSDRDLHLPRARRERM
jgi:hypothetical protein